MNYLEKKKKAMLNYVSGGGRLPSEYQEVEWIENLQKGAYFNTQLSVANATRIQANAKIVWTLTGGSAECCILGSRTPNDRCMIFNMYPLYTWEIGYGANYKSGSGFTYNELYEVSADLQSGSQTVIANGETVISSTFGGTISQTLPLYILANNNNGTATYSVGAKIYSMDISIDGVKERDFVPCYRKADDVIGLYDLVYGTFYTNSGTGTFTKGQDV